MKSFKQYADGVSSTTVSEQSDDILDVASTYKKIAVQHLRDMTSKSSTKANKEYARKMHARALEASKMDNHTDALNYYRGIGSSSKK